MSVLAILAWTIGIYASALAFVLGFFYLLPRPENQGFDPSARVFRSFLLEWLAAMLTQLMLPFGRILWPFRSRRRNGHPVIFVHGYGQNRADFYCMALLVRKSHAGPLVGFNYWYMASVEHNARRLAAFVERWAGISSTSKVDLVCHSLGGIVARYLVERLDGACRVRQLITIASPHHGTWWAKFGLGRSSRQIEPDSPEHTLKLAGPPDGVVYRNIWSAADALLIPPESASNKLARQDLVFDHLGHISLLVAPSVIRQVGRWIDEDDGRNRPSSGFASPTM